MPRHPLDLTFILLVAASWPLFTQLIRAEPVNRSIDDEYGDPFGGGVVQYKADWQQGAECGGCFATPDRAFAFNHTWHDSTADGGRGPRELTLTFNGSAVYVYFILDDHIISDSTTATSFNITLNGRFVDSFEYNPNGAADFIYNSLVYFAENLDNHTSTVVLNSSGDPPSLLLFDYAIYTTDSEVEPLSGSESAIIASESATHFSATTTISSPNIPAGTTAANPPTSRSTPVGPIVGGVVGGTGGISLVILTIICLLRRRKRFFAREEALHKIEPLVSSANFATSQPVSRMHGEKMQDVFASTSLSTANLSARASSTASTNRSRDRREQGDEDIRERIDSIQAEIARLHRTMRVQHEGVLSGISGPPEYQSAYDVDE